MQAAPQPGMPKEELHGAAEDDLRRALALKSDHPHVRCQLAWVLAIAQDRREALEQARRAVEEGGPCQQALLSQVKAGSDLFEWEVSIEACKELRKLQGRNPGYPLIHGILLARAGRSVLVVEAGIAVYRHRHLLRWL